MKSIAKSQTGKHNKLKLKRVSLINAKREELNSLRKKMK